MSPAGPTPWRPWRRRWSVAAKFYLVLGVLAAAVVHIALVGLFGLTHIESRTTALYEQEARRANVVSLLDALSATERAAFELAASDDPVARAGLQVRLSDVRYRR